MDYEKENGKRAEKILKMLIKDEPGLEDAALSAGMVYASVLLMVASRMENEEAKDLFIAHFDRLASGLDFFFREKFNEPLFSIVSKRAEEEMH